ncbi:MAG: hypothetical protein VKO21_03360 [Candidatus Sericytochromatia bacterium]|nr:hypothetical protein [Candidatus Sericytochromatia bacterium]
MSHLRPNTLYAYQLEAEDTAGQQSVSELGTFRTQPVKLTLTRTGGTDTTLQTRIDRNVAGLTGVTLTVASRSWTSLPPGDAISSSLPDHATSASVARLLPNLTYYAQVSGTETVAGTSVTSAVFPLKTLPVPLTLVSSQITRNSATFTFTSTSAGTGGMKIGTGSNHRSFSYTYATETGTRHIVTVKGLSAKTSYSAHAVLRQSHGNEAGLSAKISFRTPR